MIPEDIRGTFFDDAKTTAPCTTLVAISTGYAVHLRPAGPFQPRCRGPFLQEGRDRFIFASVMSLQEELFIQKADGCSRQLDAHGVAE